MLSGRGLFVCLISRHGTATPFGDIWLLPPPQVCCELCLVPCALLCPTCPFQAAAYSKDLAAIFGGSISAKDPPVRCDWRRARPTHSLPPRHAEHSPMPRIPFPRASPSPRAFPSPRIPLPPYPPVRAHRCSALPDAAASLSPTRLALPKTCQGTARHTPHTAHRTPHTTPLTPWPFF